VYLSHNNKSEFHEKIFVSNQPTASIDKRPCYIYIENKTNF